MNIELLDFLIHAVNFVLMALLLWLLLWRPVSKYINGRADRVRDERDKAEKLNEEAKSRVADADARLGSVSRDAETLRRESTAQANAEAAQIVADAGKRAEAIIEEAEKRAKEIKAEAAAAAQEETVENAAALAGKIIGREVNIDDNRRLAEEFFTELEKNRYADKN